MNETWPPSYDWDGLLATIKKLIAHDKLISNFYDSDRTGGFTQGDIVRLNAKEVLINAECKPEAVDSSTFWVLTANTCDLDRSLKEAPWAQMIPIDLVDELSDEQVRKFRRYETNRGFYMPYWANGANEKEGLHGVADLCRPVTISRVALNANAQLVARLNWYSWLLFNSCLVRFLARGDRRNEPTKQNEP